MDRPALTLRGIEREYHISRARTRPAIAAGELPAARLGHRRIVVLRSDLEIWLRKHAIVPTRHAESVADAWIERDAKREGTA